MPRFLLSTIGLLLALAMAGCDVPQTASGASAQPSKYSLDSVFKDPKAQALALAAEQGNAAEVQRLMKQEHINPDVIFSDDDSGMPLVAWPVFTLNPTGLKAMLDNGANPNARKQGQHTESYKDGSHGTFWDHDNALVWAAKQEDPIYLKLLLDHGGDPNTPNANGETLLFQAFIWHNQWKNVQLLVERGADVNAPTTGWSLLSSYTAEGNFEASYWLLQHGADPTEGRPMGSSWPPAPNALPVIESIFWRPGDPKDPSWQRKCQQWLLQHGYKRPPLPDNFRDMRKSFGLPYDEKDIPLL